MLATRLLAFCVLAISFATADFASAQGGYTNEKFPEHGIKMELARDYEWLPIQPTEPWIVLQWNTRLKGRLQVVRIDYVSDPGPSTPGRQEPEEEGEAKGETPADEHEGKIAKEAPKLPPPINSWARYLERKLSTFDAVEVGKGKERDGFEATEYELRRKKGAGDPVGWAYVWESSKQRTFVVLGWSGGKQFEDERKIWQYIAQKMRFSEPVLDPVLVKWQRYYEMRPKFKSPAYRARVRANLGGDWKAEDTENYIVIYNTPDQPLVRRIVKDLESIREEYVKLFPSVGEIEAVSTVRVCANNAEYQQFGGPPRSAGYWSYVTEELVFYDATKREKGEKTDKANNFIVLYHEAFHQYIFYSVGEVSPHSWFNEGYGDYFSGAQIKGGKVKRIGPNPWRLDLIKDTVKKRQHAPWKEILRYEQKDYYGARVAFYYAQGWAMVYFLNECKAVQKHPVWSQILPNYFEELKRTWVEQQELLAASEDAENPLVREAAKIAARNAALEVAFKGVDLDELEQAWIEFVLTLEL